MSGETLDLGEVQNMMIYVSESMVLSKDQLTKADRAIGDGDHGVNMAKGFRSVANKLEQKEFNTLDDLFKAIGMNLLSTVGGAAGAIFGTLFIGGANGVIDEQLLTSESLSSFLSSGLEAVKKRGKVEVGDKTMVDALEPASRKVSQYSGENIIRSLEIASEAAHEGMEHTKELIAKVGKSKTLGERSIGFPDPGALSIYLMLSFMLDYVSEHKITSG